MLQVCFPSQARFRRIIERQQSTTSVLIFLCTKEEISILSMSPSRCVVHTQLLAESFKKYVHPGFTTGGSELVRFPVNSFELADAMSKSKENHNNSIVLTLENIEKPSHIDLDFINDAGEHTIPSMRVTVLQKYPQFTAVHLPNLDEASTLSRTHTNCCGSSRR